MDFNRTNAMSTVQGGPRTPRDILGNSLNIWYDLSKPISPFDQVNSNTIDSTNNTTTISRLFDFSGNNKHAVQSIKTNQFTYVTNTLNGFSATVSSATTSSMVMRVSGSLTTGPRSFFVVGKGSSTRFVTWDRNGAISGSLEIGSTAITGWNDLGVSVLNISTGGNSTTDYIMSYIFDSNQTYIYRNGNVGRTVSSNTFTLAGTNVGLLGYAYPINFNPNLAGAQAGTLYEVIFVSKVPTIDEYNSIIRYLSAKWKITSGFIDSY
jgi:hypothetical protein